MSLSVYLCPQHPVSWRKSRDGSRLIGHMLLRKNCSTESVQESASASGSESGGGILGLKVVGGKMTSAGHLGAFITKVKPGSIADVVGRLRPGDQVLEWNGRQLSGLSLEQVYDIIYESKNDSQLELVVERDLYAPAPLSSTAVAPGARPAPVPLSLSRYPPSSSFYDYAMAPAAAVAPPQSYAPLADRSVPQARARPLDGPVARRSSDEAGLVHMKLWYDPHTYQLIISLLAACELFLPDTSLPSPYCKLYLLPDRRYCILYSFLSN